MRDSAQPEPATTRGPADPATTATAEGTPTGTAILPAPRRLRDKEHLTYVSSQPCLVYGRAPAHAHHLRFTQPRAMGRKVSDEYTVPLCARHHREVHDAGNEVGWWQRQKIDPVPAAFALWQESRSIYYVSTPSSVSGMA